MLAVLASLWISRLLIHALAPDLLRRDAFDDFVEDRRRRLSRLVEVAMGKPVVYASEAAEYDEQGVWGKP